MCCNWALCACSPGTIARCLRQDYVRVSAIHGGSGCEHGRVFSPRCSDRLLTPVLPPTLTSECVLLQMPGHQGKLHFASGSASDSVFGTHDPMRTANRLQEREEKCQACA